MISGNKDASKVLTQVTTPTYLGLDCSSRAIHGVWLDDQEKILAMLKWLRASLEFDARFIERKTYNPNEFEELLEFSDDERLLAFSEGRVKLIQWLVLTPKVSN